MDLTINNLEVEIIPLKILAVDDTKVNLMLLRSALTQSGHTVITASSGEEALERFIEDKPDVVLMDVMMPGIGGIEATRRIRALNVEHWVPIIFISALSHRDDMVKGLEAGGDDYLTKPVDLILLQAKIVAMQRISVLKNKLYQAYEALRVNRDRAEYELNMARDLIEHMVAESSAKVPCVELWLQSATNLSGDMIITQKYGNDREYVLLADAMGHGLPAALPLVPLVQVFSSMSQRGFAVPAIVREMNTCLKSLLPVGNFVALTLLSIDRGNRVVEVWNGGNPAMLLLDAAGNPVREFKSRHPAVGILRGDDFDAGSEWYQWNEPGWLAACSDGMTDATNAEGVAFGITRIVTALKSEKPFDSLKQAVIGHLEGHPAHDDISLAVVCLR